MRIARKSQPIANLNKGSFDAERPVEDPIKSHDGMDVNPFSAIVETTGYDFRNDVLQETRSAFEQGMENQRTTRRGRDDWER